MDGFRRPQRYQSVPAHVANFYGNVLDHDHFPAMLQYLNDALLLVFPKAGPNGALLHGFLLAKWPTHRGKRRSIVVTTSQNADPVLEHLVHQSVFLIDPPGPCSS
jgi:hypothetical protein